MEDSIVPKHEVIFDFLLKLHEKDKSFIFVPRKRNYKNRLAEGYWFIGNRRYLNVSFWDGGDSKEKIHNIGFVVKEDGKSYIEVAAQDSEEKAKFLTILVEHLGGFKRMGKKNKWQKDYSNKNYLTNLESFLKEVKPVVDDLIDQYKPGGIRFLNDAFYKKYVRPVIDLRNERGRSGEPDKIARICWNHNGWKRPSGREGKSRSEDSYEYKVGYGYEEWLLATDKLINEYHYGYLQPVAKVWSKYQDKIFNISLYSINAETNDRWWIGTINRVQILSSDECKKVFDEYVKNGWLEEMKEQIKEVGLSGKAFLQPPYGFFNVKFQLKDLQLLDAPQRISNKDPIISSTYYVLLNKNGDPDLEIPLGKDPDFNPGHKVRKRKGVAHYGERKSEIDYFHGEMQNNVYKQFVKLYGHDNVRTERPIGLGAAVDLSVKTSGMGEVFYEFKTDNSIRACIRQALAQLLEYSYFPDEERAKKLIIVSQNPITLQAKSYLGKIRKQFNIPVHYQQYSIGEQCLVEEEY